MKPEMKNRRTEVTNELNRRAKKEDEHAKQLQKVEQAKAIAMEGQGTLDKYKTTIEMCDEAFAVTAASAGLPLTLVDNKHFRKFLATVAACGTRSLPSRTWRSSSPSIAGHRRTSVNGQLFVIS